MMEKTTKKGGSGLHLDIVLLTMINIGCAIFGGPWVCAATVRAVSHVSALVVMSTTHAPGESPKIIDVRGEAWKTTDPSHMTIMLLLQILQRLT